jgi:hypothetical protein
MTFFKVIQNNKVVSVGTVFLEWNAKKHRMFVSDVDEGQFVQAFDESQVYRDTWMKPIPQGVGPYVLATVIIINEQEYLDLKELLEEKEEIINTPVVQQVETPVVQQIPEEEKPMTIAEMRELILSQQKQIDALMKKLSD